MEENDVSKGLIWNMMDLGKNYNVKKIIIPGKQGTVSGNIKNMFRGK
jgi:hypothetical protein